MRVILISAVTVVIIAVAAHFSLNSLDWSARDVYKSDHNSVRL